MVTLNKIYTRTGDAGATRLVTGESVSKADPRVEAYGGVDELNAVLPSEVNSSDQIEDINAMLNEMGISVVDAEDADDAEKDPAENAGSAYTARSAPACGARKGEP